MKMYFIAINFCFCITHEPWICSKFQTFMTENLWLSILGDSMSQLSRPSSCKFFYVSLCFFFLLSFLREWQPPTLYSWQRQNPTIRFIFIYTVFWMILQHETNIKFWGENKHLHQWNVHFVSVSKRFLGCSVLCLLAVDLTSVNCEFVHTVETTLHFSASKFDVQRTKTTSRPTIGTNKMIFNVLHTNIYMMTVKWFWPFYKKKENIKWFNIFAESWKELHCNRRFRFTVWKSVTLNLNEYTVTNEKNVWNNIEKSDNRDQLRCAAFHFIGNVHFSVCGSDY